MLLVISPAKTLDYETRPTTRSFTLPDYLDDAQRLVDRARMYSVDDIAALMQVSTKLARLNVERFAQWRTPFTRENAKQAILAFKGDVYAGLDVTSLSAPDLQFAQNHLRILSGLYGVLRPLDLMQPYRMEMGRAVDTDRGRNLYTFWGTRITEGLNQQLKRLKTRYLINLASREYFKAVKPKALDGEIITPEFKELRDGEYRMFGVYAKKARGQLSRFMIQNRLTEPAEIKAFDIDGYRFNAQLSDDAKWVFTRHR